MSESTSTPKSHINWMLLVSIFLGVSTQRLTAPLIEKFIFVLNFLFKTDQGCAHQPVDLMLHLAGTRPQETWTPSHGAAAPLHFKEGNPLIHYFGIRWGDTNSSPSVHAKGHGLETANRKPKLLSLLKTVIIRTTVIDCLSRESKQSALWVLKQKHCNFSLVSSRENQSL